MMKCMPIVTAIESGTIAFHVVIVETNHTLDAIHTMYGGGTGNVGEKIGEASLILRDCSETWERKYTEVLYLDGYRNDGKDFCVETEKAIVAACKVAANAFW